MFGNMLGIKLVNLLGFLLGYMLLLGIMMGDILILGNMLGNMSCVMS